MPAFTTNLNLYLPGGGSQAIGGSDEVADIDKINENFQKIDVFSGNTITSVNKAFTYTGIFADRSTVVPAPNEGDEYFATDTNVLYRYVDSAWVGFEPGSYVVRPSSVTGAGATLESDGTVKLSDANNINIDILDIFSSRFLNYRMVVRITSKGGVGVNLQCLNGTTPYAGAGYFINTQALVNGVRQDSYAGAVTSMPNLIALVSGAQGGSSTDIYTPNLAERTTFMGNVFATGGVISNAVCLGSMETGDVVTGLRVILPAGANVTGTIRFYGLA